MLELKNEKVSKRKIKYTAPPILCPRFWVQYKNIVFTLIFIVFFEAVPLLKYIAPDYVSILQGK